MQVRTCPASCNKPTLTSRQSRLTKLVMANPSMISSSWELDSRLFRRGGREALAEGVECWAFLPFWEATSLPGLCSLSEQDEGFGLRASLPTASRLRTLSRLERDLRLCFNFPSILEMLQWQKKITRSPILSGSPVRPTTIIDYCTITRIHICINNTSSRLTEWPWL